MTAPPLLPGFRGDLAWLHERESHAGRPYWPSGESGITLDPGLDIRHADWGLVEAVVGPHITADQLARLKACRHLTGQDAKDACSPPAGFARAVKRRKVGETGVLALKAIWGMVSDIRISRELAGQLLPQVADPYWRAGLKRFPAVAEAPPAVHTALLSLWYNRGAGNKALAVLRPWIAARDWAEVGRQIKAMQQGHKLQNIRERRRLEGDLILAAVGEKA